MVNEERIKELAEEFNEITPEWLVFTSNGHHLNIEMSTHWFGDYPRPGFDVARYIPHLITEAEVKEKMARFVFELLLHEMMEIFHHLDPEQFRGPHTGQSNLDNDYVEMNPYGGNVRGYFEPVFQCLKINGKPKALGE